MRWRLVLLATLVATLVGAGSALGIARLLFGASSRDAPTGWPGLVAFLAPLVAIVAATVFVYRHTSRRRKLQAFLTALLAATLTLTTLLVASAFQTKQSPAPDPAPAPRNVS